MTSGPFSANSFSGDVLATQRRLRSALLDGPTIRHAPARDLAAHMLLSIDDLTACWSIATSWLQSELKCHRVDAGFGAARERDYFPGLAEARNSDYDVPSFGGGSVFNRDPVMQAMWFGSRPIILADIKQDRRVSPYLRRRISGARTKSKFGWALRSSAGSYGLICADWTEHFAPEESGLYDCFEHTVADVLGPIIAAAKQIDGQDAGVNSAEPASRQSAPAVEEASTTLDGLTASELDIAKLVAQGLSYKEIARIRDRSFSTIDHQLRSIRQKTGVSSTAALISFLAKIESLAE